MTGHEVNILVRYRATHAESIVQRHADFMAKMARIGPPLGFAGMRLPEAPDCGAELCAIYNVHYPIRGLRLQGLYMYRGERYVYEDRMAFDDYVEIIFNSANPAVDYRAILHEHLPKVIEAFGAYRSDVWFGLHSVRYCGGSKNSNPVYERLLADKSTDINGRNNIYVLEPAQYWDGEVCRRALGYGPDEAIRRLRGEAPLAAPLMEGIYVVLNDDPQLTYEQFAAMNERYKGILGLI